MLSARCPYCDRWICDSDGDTVRAHCARCRKVVIIRLDVLRAERELLATGYAR